MQNINANQQEVQKSINISIAETKENLRRTIDDAKLPVSIMSMILKEIMVDVINAEQQILNNERRIYAQALMTQDTAKEKK